jgi:hypothetical protein
MRDKQCEVIRRELEEVALNEEFSGATAEHMRGCADCREFQRQQLKLRQIVGSLGVVNAPADFDFRLRARLAADSEKSGIRFWTFAVRGLATVAVLVVFGVGAAIVWQSTRPSTTVATAPQQGQSQQAQQGQAEQGQAQQGQAEPRQAESPRHDEQANAQLRNDPAVVVGNIPRRNPNRSSGNKSGQRIASVDRASLRAPIYALPAPAYGIADLKPDTEPVFPIDASLQSVKVSLDDGRGNARTISFPTVSFGSQRVPATGYQFAPKDVW